ncbi:hypothetical protein B0H14DRAFT_2611859 [Mycena olivaceomarginata]|nr:hypothetical protein B0H14DRAFT_2611859 [Mycena olivaceomarginata]
MAQSNPKPTLYADRATVTSDHVTCAAKCASSVPTVNSPTSAAPAAAALLPVVIAKLPPIADAPTMGVLASVATASPLTAAPAVTVLSAAVVPTPIPTLVPVSAAIVAVLTRTFAATPTTAVKPPIVTKTAAPASKATSSPAAKGNAVTTTRPAAAPTSAAKTTAAGADIAGPPTTETTALSATTTTTTTAAPAMVLVPQRATTSPPALVTAQNAAQPMNYYSRPGKKMRQNLLYILSNGTVLPRNKNDQVSSVKTRYPYDRQQKHQHPTISPHISSYLTEERL